MEKKMRKTNSILRIATVLVLLLSSCRFQLPTAGNTTTDEKTPTASTVTQEQSASPAAAAPQVVTLTDPEALQSAYNSIFDTVSPSVVHIQVTSQVNTTEMQIPGFSFGLPENNQSQPQIQQSSGSGFVWNTDGMIVTNNHVIEDAQTITVEFYDGTSVDAKVIGTDPESDLGVIQVDVDASYLQPVTLADSTQVQPGDIAIAIGNPYGLQNTMTVGIVSALGRSLSLDTTTSTGATYSIPDVIQTDASINPGNSGGVLLNLGGQVIGVTSAIESTSGANAGIGFVIPSIIVNNVVPSLISDGSYEHPWIGISGITLISDIAEEMDLPISQHGALVNEVVIDSPADLAGLKGSDKTMTINDTDVAIGGDIITAIDDVQVNDFEDLVAYLARYTKVDQTVTLTVLRDGKEQKIELTLGARSTQQSQASGTVWMGAQIMDFSKELAQAAGLDESIKGVLIVQISSGSPAEKAGLKGSYKSVEINGETLLVGGDIITAVDGKSVESADAMKEIIASHAPGDEVTLTINRDGKTMSVPLTFEARP
jgi:serine protease Do